jgi:hypothetical protein
MRPAEGRMGTEDEAALVAYDDGMGALWAYVPASSAAEIAVRFPELTVFESKPEWPLTRSAYSRIFALSRLRSSRGRPNPGGCT